MFDYFISYRRTPYNNTPRKDFKLFFNIGLVIDIFLNTTRSQRSGVHCPKKQCRLPRVCIREEVLWRGNFPVILGN
jgi:hypothetical protein